MATIPQARPGGADKAWQRRAPATVVLLLLAAAVLGFIVLPVIQGRSAGIDAWTAFCRSLGIKAGSPVVQQPSSNGKAEPVSEVAWTTQVIDRLNHPNVANGQDIAANICAACHGTNGTSPGPQFPNMAGQSAFAIYKQLHDFKSAARANDLMAGIAAGLTEDQMIDVAAHFAALTRGTLDPQAVAVNDPDIVRLVEDGDPARGLPACSACHGARAGGPIETPTLTGQRQEYLLMQLQAYLRGQRHNDVYGRMRTIAAKLTLDEMERVTRYYAGIR